MLRHQKCGEALLGSDDLPPPSLSHFTLLFRRTCLSNQFALMMFAEGDAYAPEAEVSFLSSLVSP